MISLLPDFTKEEKIYWKNIEEILEYKEIIKHYDKLLLIRLKSFVEGQIKSREFQVFLILERISNKETFADWEDFEKDIKERLGNIILNGTFYKDYLEADKIDIIEKLMSYLLITTIQYCCNYSTLKRILEGIYEELDKNNTKVKKITTIAKPEEAAAKIDLLRKDIVKIDPEVLQEVYESLKEYFDNEDYLLLLELFEGNEITKKLVFKNYKNRLTELFKRIEYNDYFQTSPTKMTIANWIVANFTTKKSDFNYGNVYVQELSAYDFSIDKSKRICKSINFLSENELQQRYLDNKK